MERLPAPTAIVTGGSRGLGLACARQLAEDGYGVAILDIEDDDGNQAAAALPRNGSDHLYVRCDITSAAAVTAAVTTVSQVLGPPAALINNAGILRPTRFLDIAEAEWDDVVNVSVKGAFLCARACLPGMIQAGFGRIVNISSTAGKTASTLGGAHYTCAKTALLGLTRALAKEFGGHGITVNAVCPGLFSTQMVRNNSSAEALDQLAKSFPVGRLGDPREVGSLIGFLCSPKAAYITGAAVDVNGGDLMV